MRWSVTFKLQLYHLVFSTISLVICFTTMSVIRNFPYYSGILYSEKPFLHKTMSHRCLPYSERAERVVSEKPPLPFSPFLFFAEFCADPIESWASGTPSQQTKQFYGWEHSFLLWSPPTFALIDWATRETGFRRWRDLPASGEVL